MILSYIVPGIWMFTAPGLSNRQWIFGALWQIFPVYLVLLQYLLGAFVREPTKEEQVQNPKTDLPYLYMAYAFSATVGLFAYIYIRFTSPVTLLTVFFSGLENPSQPLPLIKAAVKMLRYDQISCFGSGTVWVFLHFRDLKIHGLVQEPWWHIITGYIGILFLAGPGAAMACIWALRENILAKSKEMGVKSE
jgi:hypothetical protein